MSLLDENGTTLLEFFENDLNERLGYKGIFLEKKKKVIVLTYKTYTTSVCVATILPTIKNGILTTKQNDYINAINNLVNYFLEREDYEGGNTTL